ncbi:aromatic-ring hydroxylase C-terminal domain-containing protein [Streptosporangium canum]|uniref:aromatic-ring hydroxylase C-terminal domain-containing protein n=1 Tax=Streptosporangium canum TaxID=324952 RepID=UPI0036929D85
MTMEQSLLRLSDAQLHWAPGMAAEQARVGAINAPVVHMGYRYGTPMSELPSMENPALDLDGSVGSRVPHLWVADGVSSLDLVGSRFTVLADAGDPVWASAGAQVIDGWPYGPLLVRPDGIVAWKATIPDALPTAMNDLLRR